MKRRASRLLRRRDRYGYAFIAPFLVGFLLIFLPCMVKSGIYAFHDVRLTSAGMVSAPVGWENFHRLFFVDADFRAVLLTALKNILVDTLLIMVFSFFVANVLNQKFIGRSAARAILFLPVILATGLISSVETGDLSMSLYGNAAAGTVGSAMAAENTLFSMEGLLTSVSADISPALVTFLTDSVENTAAIINASGVQILIFIAALQSIPQSVFEASRVEGATVWQEFWKITFPMLTPMLLVNLVYTIVDTFTRPSYGILDMVQEQAFNNNRMGFASAISWVFFIMIALVLAVVMGLVSRKVHYSD